jgi:hypothetical protein
MKEGRKEGRKERDGWIRSERRRSEYILCKLTIAGGSEELTEPFLLSTVKHCGSRVVHVYRISLVSPN